ncbi:MAG: ROK family protein [Oscillospiraceae bacterium]|nr:ROK family protein [Oscillospiraceae bacterium]
MKHYLGIDLGGTNIAAGIVTADGVLLHKESIPTESHRGHEHVIANMIALCQKVMADSGVGQSDIASIGVGSPGLCDRENGVTVFAENLQFDQVPIRDPLQAALGLPVRLENDANCAALAESRAGAAKGMKDSVTVTLGTGVGGGIVIDGKLATGAHGAGGEIGHILICMDGEPCTCGTRGCWEAYASATALIRQAERAAIENPQSALAAIHAITGKAVFDAAAAGDGTANAVVIDYLRYVAVGLANLINVLDPAVIVIGGGISAQGEAILAPIREILAEYVLGGVLRCKVVAATLGNDAGIIGAALLGAEK